MPCYICGNSMESMIIDPRDKKSRPCTVCEEIVQENLESLMKKKRKATDGELPLLELDEEFTNIEEIIGVELENSNWHSQPEEVDDYEG